MFTKECRSILEVIIKATISAFAIYGLVVAFFPKEVMTVEVNANTNSEFVLVYEDGTSELYHSDVLYYFDRNTYK